MSLDPCDACLLNSEDAKKLRGWGGKRESAVEVIQVWVVHARFGKTTEN
jgi:hypothetical protein